MKKKKIELDEYEKEILKSYERGEWTPVPNMKEEIKRLAKYAKAAIKKTERINIRLNKEDLSDIKLIAVEEGLPYQTLIASVLHKYAKGRLTDKNIKTS